MAQEWANHGESLKEDLMIVPDQLAIFRSRRARVDSDIQAAHPIEAAEAEDSEKADESSEAGMSTAEYAVGTIAACALATAG
jgi:hypothetical protein